MDDKEKYRQALEKAKRLYEQGTITESLAYIFPELAESEDERIRKRLLTDFSVLGREEWGGLKVKDICAWLEKHTYTQRDVDDAYLKGVTDAKNELEKQGELPEGCVRKQVAEAKEALYTAEVDSEEVEQKSIGCRDMAIMLKKAFGNVGKKTWGGIEVKDILTWLKMQDSQKATTLWHDVTEMPLPYNEEELLVERKKDDNTSNYYVVKYNVDARQFILLGIPIDDVTRWAYVSDILTQSEVTKISEQDELTEFKEEFMAIIDSWCGGNGYVYAQRVKEGVRNDVNKLLALARKQILSELPKWRKDKPSATTLYIKYGDYYMEIKELDKIFKMLIKEE